MNATLLPPWVEIAPLSTTVEVSLMSTAGVAVPYGEPVQPFWKVSGVYRGLGASANQAPSSGQAHLRTVPAEYALHYNTARPHQGIAQHVPDDDPAQTVATVVNLDTARIRRRSVLGDLTSEYQIAA